MYFIQMHLSGMPQDIDEVKGIGTCFGPYRKRTGAETALRRRGWERNQDDEWQPLSPPLGDRTFATIEMFKSRPKILKSPRSLR